MSLKGILTATAVVIASLVSAGVAQPAFAAAQPAAGSLDPTFGTGGKVLTNLGIGAGSIIVGGDWHRRTALSSGAGLNSGDGELSPPSRLPLVGVSGGGSLTSSGARRGLRRT